MFHTHVSHMLHLNGPAGRYNHTILMICLMICLFYFSLKHFLAYIRPRKTYQDFTANFKTTIHGYNVIEPRNDVAKKILSAEVNKALFPSGYAVRPVATGGRGGAEPPLEKFEPPLGCPP